MNGAGGMFDKRIPIVADRLPVGGYRACEQKPARGEKSSHGHPFSLWEKIDRAVPLPYGTKNPFLTSIAPTHWVDTIPPACTWSWSV